MTVTARLLLAFGLVAASMLASAAPAPPREGGQAAFAAIAEIVALLDADPATDWQRVDLDALRAHLVDMDLVTLRARVRTEQIPNGARFHVGGDAEVRAAVQRMVGAHGAMLGGESGLRVETATTADGAVLTAVSDDPAGTARIRGLGFFGLMALGTHHQRHHLALARGDGHHGH